MKKRARVGMQTIKIGGAILILGIALFIVFSVLEVSTGIAGTTALVLLPLAGLVALIVGGVIYGESQGRPGTGMLQTGGIALGVGILLLIAGLIFATASGIGVALLLPAIICIPAGIILAVIGFARRLLAAVESKSTTSA